MKIKGKIGNQTVEYEIPTKSFRELTRRQNEKPHVHHSKPHPSNNEKQCDVCGRMMTEHYHVCGECLKFMRESFVKRIRELESEVEKLKKKGELKDKKD